MDKNLLRGNFKVQNPVVDQEPLEEATLSGSQKIAKELRKAALAKLGGSMVYVERQSLEWEGDEDHE